MQSDDISFPHSVTAVESQPAVWISGPSCIRQKAVGEAHYAEHIGRIAAAIQGRSEIPVPAWLMPEPENVHDPSAVMVWVHGGKAGYLSRELAQVWQPALQRLRGRYGCPAACQATLDPPSAANHGRYGLILWLPPLFAVGPTSHRAPSAGPAPKPPPPPSGRAPRSAVPVLSTPEEELESIQDEIGRTRAELKRLKRELASVEESIDIQSFGFYQPKYGFESSAQYTARLKGIRDEQQALIKDGAAAPCDAKWTVGGSATEGKKMVKQQAKLMLRAFNGECDGAIAKVRYDNVTTLEQRMSKAYEEVNKLGEVQRVFISRRYFDLKLAELHLVHEHREKVQAEKEEQKRIREQMREEQKAAEEIERAKAEAEKEEAKSAAALEKARAELDAAAATSKQHEKLEALVARLENELSDALDRKAKAIARAQLTKSGHVYVLSNIGSFGEGVYKIGMTRRLDPYERVDELGDASVPFPFDVHAIIFADDAPGLEHKLHDAFASRRVNLVNARKEYFRVTLDEIRVEVQKAHGLVTFQLDAEAEEYRKTVAATTATVALLAPDTSVVVGVD